MRRLALLAAPLLVVRPATAGTGVDTVVAGLSCGLESSPPSQPRQPRTGTLWGGPFTVTGADGRERTVGLACSIHVGPDPTSPEVYRAESPSGTVAPQPFSYVPPEPAGVYFLCTEVVVYEPPYAPQPRYYDADPATPGAQCAPPEERPGQMATVDVVPSDPTAWWCVRVVYNQGPFGYQEVCNPF